MSIRTKRRKRIERKAARAIKHAQWSKAHDLRIRDEQGRVMRYFALRDPRGKIVGLSMAALVSDLPWNREGMPAGWTASDLAGVVYDPLSERGIPTIRQMGDIHDTKQGHEPSKTQEKS